MTTTRTITTITAVAALAATGVAGAAQEPVLDTLPDVHGKAPLTIPGTGIQEGESLGRGHLEVREVRNLAGDREIRIAIQAPRGKVLRGLAVPEGQDLGFAVEGKGSYVGKRSVVLRVFAHGDAAQDGKVYAYVR